MVGSDEVQQCQSNVYILQAHFTHIGDDRDSGMIGLGGCFPPITVALVN